MSTDDASTINELCRRYCVQRLELFGSAATGDYQAGASDLDFLVEFAHVPDESYPDTYFGLLEGLEAFFDRPVDLVVSNAIKNPYFRRSVDATKVLIYAA